MFALTLTLYVIAAVMVVLWGGCAAYVTVSYLSAFLFRPSRWSWAILRAAVVELLVAWLLVPLWPLWTLIGAGYRQVVEGEGEAAGVRNPVILLHGFGMNRTQWVWMGRRLLERGHGPIYGMNYFSLQSVRRSAKHLARKVEAILAREGCEKVDIVAHSLGGLVARYFIERLDGAGRVGRLITMGTPHGGTRLGRAGIGIPAARDLLGGSILLSELGPVRSGAVYTSIWSRADAIVQPPESASIAPAGVDAVVEDLGHLSLVLSPRVVALIDARLRT